MGICVTSVLFNLHKYTRSLARAFLGLTKNCRNQIRSTQVISNPKCMSEGPNVSTTPITAMGCRQCLSLSVLQLKGKHCRKPHCHNGVIDMFRQKPMYIYYVVAVLIRLNLLSRFYWLKIGNTSWLLDDFGGNPTIVQPPAKLPASYQEAAKAHVVLCSTYHVVLRSIPPTRRRRRHHPPTLTSRRERPGLRNYPTTRWIEIKVVWFNYES